MGSSSALNLPLLYPPLSSPANTRFTQPFLFAFAFLFIILSALNNASVFCFFRVAGLFWGHSPYLLSPAIHVICRYVLMAGFYKDFHLCIMCSSNWERMWLNKSICHMSKIPVRRFTGRFLRLLWCLLFHHGFSLTERSFRQKLEGFLLFLMLDFTCSSSEWRRLQMCVTHWRNRLTQHWCHRGVEGFILYSWELEPWLLVFPWSVHLDDLKWVLHTWF